MSSKSSSAVDITSVSKSYRTYTTRSPKKLLFFGLLSRKVASSSESLVDITFKANFGEIIGIVGENGSGKTTLLKLIAKNITPSNGIVQVHGLVEANFDYHHSFILGWSVSKNIAYFLRMSGKSERDVNHLLSEVIDFTLLGDVADLPMKELSHGMRAKISIALAIVKKPEILLLDEAFATVDVYFRDRVLIKIRELREQGVVIILASHSSEMLVSVCNKVIFLKNGKIVTMGDPAMVNSHFLDFYGENIKAHGFKDSGNQNFSINQKNLKNSSLLHRLETLTAEIEQKSRKIQIIEAKLEEKELVDHAILLKAEDLSDQITKLWSTKSWKILKTLSLLKFFYPKLNKRLEPLEKIAERNPGRLLKVEDLIREFGDG